MIEDSDDDDVADDVTTVATNFNATRLVSRKNKDKDRPNYFLCFKVCCCCFMLLLLFWITSG